MKITELKSKKGEKAVAHKIHYLKQKKVTNKKFVETASSNLIKIANKNFC